MREAEVAVITGGGGGVGLACAHRFGGRYKVLLVDAVQQRLEAAERQLNEEGYAVTKVHCDVSSPSSVAALSRAVGEAGGLDLLVHSAGISPSMADPWRILDVNLFGTLAVLDALLPHARPSSVAVCIASIAGYREGAQEHDALLSRPDATDFRVRLAAEAGIERSELQAYSLSKRAVMLAVERRAGEWAARGARIVSVSPGLIPETPMGVLELPNGVGPLAGIVALGRGGRAEEIAAACALLASPDASYITGCDLRVDGGTIAGYASLAGSEVAHAWHHPIVRD